jgi:hypothetical protein
MSGLYATDGSTNVTVVPGTSLTGLYAADGSYNVVPSPGTGQVGLHAPCGAYYVTLVGAGSLQGYYAADGSMNVYPTLGRNSNTHSGTPITVVSGSLVTVPSGLISYWPEDTSTTSGSTSNDIIGANNGTNTAITSTTGEIAQAYVFNGTTSKVTVPTASNINFTGTTPFSVALWVNAGAFVSNGFQSIIGNINSAGLTGWEISLPTTATPPPATNTVYQVVLGNTFPTNIVQVTSPVGSAVAGVAQHFVLTYTGNQNASGMIVYINGSPVTLSIVNNNLTLSTVSPANITLGNSSRAAPNPYLGWLDDVRIYNRVLSAGEVTSIYNAGLAGKR